MAVELRRLRGRRERGAAAVEFALVMPLLFAILLGIVNYGLWFNDSLSVRQGVRESARKAVLRSEFTGCPGTGMAAVTCGTRSQIKPGGVAYAKVFVRDRITGVPTTTWARAHEVVVCGMVKAISFSNLVPLPAGGYVKSRTVMSIESATPPLPTDTSYADNLPTGQSWSWCT